MNIAFHEPQRGTPQKPLLQSKWPPQGQWTYEDYCRLPEDGLIYEIINGELFMSPAPRPGHQKISGKIFNALSYFAETHDAGEAYYSPIDVILPGLATPVQPDVLFIRKERLDIIKNDCIEGAADIIVEVLSTGNWFVDRGKKSTVYAKAGVREYWIVDPAMRTIELFHLRDRAFAPAVKFGVRATVRSKVLKSFSLKVKNVFPAAG